MRHLLHSACAAALACVLVPGMALAQSSGDSTVSPAVASQQAREIAKGDPARWYREDATEQERLRTLQKEIAAAYEEAKAACRMEQAAARADCLKQARTTWQQDMAQVREQMRGAVPRDRPDDRAPGAR